MTPAPPSNHAPPADAHAAPPAPLDVRVSVVLPTCDRAEQTRRCLDALAKQTFDSYEIIVVDDASTDGTPDMLEAFAREHPDLPVRILRQESNLGANRSRNRGVQASRAPFVAFLDSDCVAEPDWIEQLMAGFEDDDVVAVTGLVLDPEPANVWELAFAGTHRIAAAGPVRRVVAGNLGVRREPLLAVTFDEDFVDRARHRDGRPDTSFSGRCDEEGVFLQLRAQGWTFVARPEARVFHDHRYDARAFRRQAYHGGRAAAELVYKYRLPPRLDMLPFMLGYGSLLILLPVALLAGLWLLLLLPAFFLLGAAAAIAYNEVVRKGKSIAQLLLAGPALTLYYHLRFAGYVHEAVGLRLGRGGRIKRIHLRSIPPRPSARAAPSPQPMTDSASR